MNDTVDEDLPASMEQEYFRQHGLTQTKDDIGEMREALRDTPKYAALPEDSALFAGMLKARRMVAMHRDLASLHDRNKRAKDAREMQGAMRRADKIIEKLGSDAGSGHVQDIFAVMRERLRQSGRETDPVPRFGGFGSRDQGACRGK
jgi:hypothetical protein